MLELFYPEDERRFFTDREHHLALLGRVVELLGDGVRQHLALAGLRRVGKTLILKEFLWRQRSAAANSTDGSGTRVGVAFIDLQRLALTPERFAAQYVGQLIYWLDDGPAGPFERTDDPAWQMVAVARHGQAELTDYLLTLQRELQKERPDQHRLLELAFGWPEAWGRATDRRVVVLLDEFPEILALDNFPQVSGVTALFRAVLQSQSRVAYVAAGSMLSLMERIFLGADSPLFVHFRLETVGPLDPDAANDLARARLAAAGIPGAQITPDVLAVLRQVTGGHPFYLQAVTQRLAEAAALAQLPVTPALVQQAFVLETLSPTGRIYNLCRYVLETSLQRTRGATIPQAILQVLAREDTGLSLTQIARLLRRPTGAMRQVLQWLVQVDLVVQAPDRTYTYGDAVLHVWAAYYYAGIELAGQPRQQALEALVTDVMTRYQRAATELGLAKESQVRELVALFAGQIVDGALLGLALGGTTPPPCCGRRCAGW